MKAKVTFTVDDQGNADGTMLTGEEILKEVEDTLNDHFPEELKVENLQVEILK